jgi:hypothetical protein
MYSGYDVPGTDSAAASGAEGGTIGLALGFGPLVLYADARSAAAAVDGVVFTVCDIAADAGIEIACFFVAHEKASFYGVPH